MSLFKKCANIFLFVFVQLINVRDDDLGFDPFHETQKAFAEMMEKEEPNHLHNFQPKLVMQHNHHHRQVIQPTSEEVGFKTLRFKKSCSLLSSLMGLRNVTSSVKRQFKIS